MVYWRPGKLNLRLIKDNEDLSLHIPSSVSEMFQSDTEDEDFNGSKMMMMNEYFHQFI